MHHLIHSLQKSLVEENWYGALFLAMSMPDICSKLENPLEKLDGLRYQRWFDQNLGSLFKSKSPHNHVLMTGKDCWALRCSLLHQGIADTTKQKSKDTVSKFCFTTLPLHRCKHDGVLVLNTKIFCEEMIDAVEKWLEYVATRDAVVERINSLMKIHQGPGFSYAAIG